MPKLPAIICSSTSPRVPSSLSGNLAHWLSVIVAAGATTAICIVVLLSNGPMLVRPVQAFSKRSRQAGAAVFHAKGCEHCHGVDGIGTDRGPDLSGIGKRWKKDRIELQITDGGGGMPPFGDALQPDEVTALVDYLRAKRKPSKPLTQPAPSAKASSEDTGVE